MTDAELALFLRLRDQAAKWYRQSEPMLREARKVVPTVRANASRSRKVVPTVRANASRSRKAAGPSRKVVPTEARTYTDRPSATDAELGFMARRRALCFLPRTNPGDQLRGVPANTPANRLLAVTQG